MAFDIVIADESLNIFRQASTTKCIMNRVITTCILILVCTPSLSAKTRSVIAGRVTDSAGAAIAKARVLIHWDSSGSRVGVTDNLGTKQDVIVLSDANGAYSMNVPEGFYDVFVSAPMFTPAAAKVIAKQGQRATLNVKLRVDPLVSKEIGGMEVYAAPKK